LLITVWDRVILFREKRHSERVKNIAEALPILAQVADLVSDKKLSPEQGELIKRKLIEGTTKFLDTGAIIPEFSQTSVLCLLHF